MSGEGETQAATAVIHRPIRHARFFSLPARQREIMTAAF